jgi:hypothetical protein
MQHASYRKEEAFSEELITKKELSRRLKVCTRTVENLTNKGIIPMIRVGASPRYCWEDVSTALKNTPQIAD